ncbi:hypothetical protein OV450_1396 [Actinobacteria bacterium OV450]|nr:hypothetical protein OV450_1396 [Actinobacteria bacterium OV450]
MTAPHPTERAAAPRSAVDQLNALLVRLSGPPDFWDRPGGDWAGVPASPERREAVGDANAFYKLGSKALRRGESETAGQWLGQAVDHNHPGALLRLAVLFHRVRGLPELADTMFIVAEAGQYGHGDAPLLLRHYVTGVREHGAHQDPEFAEELHAAVEAGVAGPATPAG